MKRFVLLALLATPLVAQQQVASTAMGTLVVHDDQIELIDENGVQKWSADSVVFPGRIVHDECEAAVLDPIDDSATIVNLETGAVRRMRTGATPIEGAYVGGKLFILSRDDHTLERSDGVKLKLDVAADLLRARNGRIYVYSRVDGVLFDIDPESMSVTQKETIKPFAVDFEVDEKHLYFVHPNTGHLRTYSRNVLAPLGDLRVGSRPVDIALAFEPTPLTARILAIADPAQKQVGFVEAWQTTAAAVARGFLRGTLGFPVQSRRDTTVGNGPDRVEARGGNTVAFESATGTLWLAQRHPRVLATGVEPGSYAITKTAVVWWDGKVLQRLVF